MTYGLLPVSRPAGENNSLTKRGAVNRVCFRPIRCSALNFGTSRCTLTCFFSLNCCEDYSGSVEKDDGTLAEPSLCFLNPTRYEPFKDSLDLHLQWHYMVLFDTESDAIKVCGTYDSVGYYVILYVYDTVMCMVLYDTVSECGFSHIFTSKGRGSG